MLNAVNTRMAFFTMLITDVIFSTKNAVPVSGRAGRGIDRISDLPQFFNTGSFLLQWVNPGALHQLMVRYRVLNMFKPGTFFLIPFM